MKQHPFPLADGSNLLDRIESADLVVGHHHRDQRCFRSNGVFDRLRINTSVLINRQNRHINSFPFQSLRRIEDGAMLDHIVSLVEKKAAEIEDAMSDAGQAAEAAE